MKNFIGFILVSIIGIVAYTNPVSAISITASTSTGQVITLSSGWNTFSTPKVLDNLTFQSGGTGLFFYSLSSTGWSIVNPNITTIKPLEGYVVNNTNSGTRDISLSYKTNLSPLDMIFQKSLHSGWNIVGITSNTNPFASITSSVGIGLDFTKTSDGITNYSNKIANTFYTTTGNANLNSFLLGESYGLFLQSPLLLPGIQPQAGTDGEIGEFLFSKYSTGNSTIAYGSSGVILFKGLVSSTLPITIKEIIVTPINTGSGIDSFIDNKLVIKINGIEVGTITNLTSPQTYNISSSVINGTGSITIEGSIKNDINIYSENAFNIAITGINDSRNSSINIGTGVSTLGDRVDIKTPSAELKTATISAPSNTRIYSSAEQEIGRFAIKSNNESTRLQTITIVNSGSANLQSITNSTSSAKLIDVNTGLEVSATVTISGNTISFSSMNDTIGTNITKNYKIVLGVSSIESYYGNSINIFIEPTNITVVRDLNSNPVNITGSSITRNYILSTIAPTVLVTAINENTFKVRVTNPDSNTGITLTGVILDFGLAIPGNTTYTATACLRDLGNTNTCGGVGTSGSGTVPGLAQAIILSGLTTNMTADKNGGYIEFEVYMTSPYLLPTGGQIRVAITQLYYHINGNSTTENYVGITGASAIFTK